VNGKKIAIDLQKISIVYRIYMQLMLKESEKSEEGRHHYCLG